MDETTVTVIGMIAAFLTASVTAFLAEPVKIHFQNRAKLSTLRTGLYRELWHNYRTAKSIVEYLGKFGFSPPELFENNELLDKTIDLQDLILTQANTYALNLEGSRTDCYDQAIENDLYLIYQLPEVFMIHRLYHAIKSIPKDEEKQEVDIREAAPFFNAYMRNFSKYVFDGELDRKVLSNMMSKKELHALLQKGKSISEQKIKLKFSPHPKG